MQRSNPTCDAGSCISVRELGTGIVSMVHRRTPTLALLLSACGWRLVLLG
jgi:hypothetical protein